MKKQSFKSDIVESFRVLESFSEFLRKLSSDILKDDRLAVIIVCAGAELVLNFLVKKLCKHGSYFSSKNRAFMTKVRILDEFGVIDEKLFNNLNGLKTLRDKAAHHPDKELEWESKFAFDKESNVYKGTVEVFGEPKDLVGYLYCVWNTFFMVAVKVNAKKEFGKIVVAHKKLTKNNK